MDKQFPQLPDDKGTLVILQQLRELGTTMVHNESDKVHKMGTILVGLAVLPHFDDFTYFLVFQECNKIYNDLGEAYNPIIRRGNDYALSVIDKQIGDMGDYFNAFQLAMYHINERAKRDDTFVPLNTILWTFYMSFYWRDKFEGIVDRVYKIMEDRAKVQLNPQLN